MTLLPGGRTTDDDAWVDGLRVGQYVDAKDKVGKWTEAVVIGTSQRKVHVRFRGWSSKFNEWVPRSPDRLAPAYEHVPNWRVLDVGHRVQVGTLVTGNKSTKWRNGAVVQVRRGRVDTLVPAQVLVKLDDDGDKRWMDAQDDMLCAAGTHAIQEPPRRRRHEEESSGDDTEAIELSSDTEHGSTSDSGGGDVEIRVSKRRVTPPRAASTRAAVAAKREPPPTKKRTPDNRRSTTKRRTSKPLVDDGDDGDDDLATWREALAPGAELEVANETKRVWYEARVLLQRHAELCVRFRGWPWRYDQWLSRASDRLAPPATHLGRWRDFKLGDHVQIGFRANGNDDAPSHWERGVVQRLHCSKRTRRVEKLEVEWDCGDGVQRELRDAQDDLLAPVGVPTYPLAKKRTTDDESDEEEEEEEEESRAGDHGDHGGGGRGDDARDELPIEMDDALAAADTLVDADIEELLANAVTMQNANANAMVATTTTDLHVAPPTTTSPRPAAEQAAMRLTTAQRSQRLRDAVMAAVDEFVLSFASCDSSPPPPPPDEKPREEGDDRWEKARGVKRQRGDAPCKTDTHTRSSLSVSTRFSPAASSSSSSSSSAAARADIFKDFSKRRRDRPSHI